MLVCCYFFVISFFFPHCSIFWRGEEEETCPGLHLVRCMLTSISVTKCPVTLHVNHHFRQEIRTTKVIYCPPHSIYQKGKYSNLKPFQIKEQTQTLWCSKAGSRLDITGQFVTFIEIGHTSSYVNIWTQVKTKPRPRINLTVCCLKLENDFSIAVLKGTTCISSLHLQDEKATMLNLCFLSVEMENWAACLSIITCMGKTWGHLMFLSEIWKYLLSQVTMATFGSRPTEQLF